MQWLLEGSKLDRGFNWERQEAGGLVWAFALYMVHSDQSGCCTKTPWMVLDKR